MRLRIHQGFPWQDGKVIQPPFTPFGYFSHANPHLWRLPPATYQSTHQSKAVKEAVTAGGCIVAVGSIAGSNHWSLHLPSPLEWFPVFFCFSFGIFAAQWSTFPGGSHQNSIKNTARRIARPWWVTDVTQTMNRLFVWTLWAIWSLPSWLVLFVKLLVPEAFMCIYQLLIIMQCCFVPSAKMKMGGRDLRCTLMLMMQNVQCGVQLMLFLIIIKKQKNTFDFIALLLFQFGENACGRICLTNQNS